MANLIYTYNNQMPTAIPVTTKFNRISLMLNRQTRHHPLKYQLQPMAGSIPTRPITWISKSILALFVRLKLAIP